MRFVELDKEYRDKLWIMGVDTAKIIFMKKAFVKNSPDIQIWLDDSKDKIRTKFEIDEFIDDVVALAFETIIEENKFFKNEESIREGFVTEIRNKITRVHIDYIRKVSHLRVEFFNFVIRDIRDWPEFSRMLGKRSVAENEQLALVKDVLIKTKYNKFDEDLEECVKVKQTKKRKNIQLHQKAE